MVPLIVAGSTPTHAICVLSKKATFHRPDEFVAVLVGVKGKPAGGRHGRP